MFTLIVIQALFYFLPSYASNAAPVLLAKAGLMKSLAYPVDGGKTLGSQALFGKTKTWRGIVGGTLAGVLTVAIQSLFFHFFPESDVFLIRYDMPSILSLGVLLGLGEGLGDLIKSFFKRRLNIDSSAPFFPFDQMSFLGSLGLSMFYFIPNIEHIAAIVVLSLLIPVLANIAAFKLGWKKVWW